MSVRLPITAGILAGGQSTRMGENKAFLSWEGKTFLEHTLEQVSDFAQVIISVGDKNRFFGAHRPTGEHSLAGAHRPTGEHSLAGAHSPTEEHSLVGAHSLTGEYSPADGTILVEDEKKGYGPMEGIFQILQHAAYDWVFVTAVDLPYLHRDFIGKMAAVKREAFQAVILKETEASLRIHPLCGFYHRSCLLTLQELFEEKRRSVLALLDRILVRYVTCRELGMENRVLLNVNTREEYRKLRE